jgi:hypothetical protein
VPSRCSDRRRRTGSWCDRHQGDQHHRQYEALPVDPGQLCGPCFRWSKFIQTGGTPAARNRLSWPTAVGAASSGISPARDSRDGEHLTKRRPVALQHRSKRGAHGERAEIIRLVLQPRVIHRRAPSAGTKRATPALSIRIPTSWHRAAADETCSILVMSSCTGSTTASRAAPSIVRAAA